MNSRSQSKHKFGTKIPDEKGLLEFKVKKTPEIANGRLTAQTGR